MSTGTDSPDVELWRARWRARAWLWTHSALTSVAGCGHWSTGGTVELIRYPSGQTHATGVQTCKSVWACPVCSARILAGRAAELQAVLDDWQALGADHHVAFVTLTLRHLAGDSLADTWDAVQGCWTKVQQGRPWQTLAERYGVWMRSQRRDGKEKWRLPTVRAIETTHGRHGWHVHVHALVPFVTASDPELAVAAISQTVTTRWISAAERAGRQVSADALDVHLVTGPTSSTVGQYLAKAVYTGTLGGELAPTPGQKQARDKESRTPWQILDAASSGGADAARSAALWAEWERTSWGRRQLIISGALLDLLGREEMTDDQAFDSSSPEDENSTPAEVAARFRSDAGTAGAGLPRGWHGWERPCSPVASVVAGPCELVAYVPAAVWADLVRGDLVEHLMTELAPRRGAAADLLGSVGWAIGGTEPHWRACVLPASELLRGRPLELDAGALVQQLDATA